MIDRYANLAVQHVTHALPLVREKVARKEYLEKESIKSSVSTDLICMYPMRMICRSRCGRGGPRSTRPSAATNRPATKPSNISRNSNSSSTRSRRNLPTATTHATRTRGFPLPPPPPPHRPATKTTTTTRRSQTSS